MLSHRDESMQHPPTDEPFDSPSHTREPVRVRATATGAQAVGAFAMGAFAIGALAIGALAIGRLIIGRARIRRLDIDALVVGSFRITDSLETPCMPHESD
jgi:hypothetical protein